MDLKRKRILALVNAWSRIVKEGITSRDRAVEILKKCYEELRIEPIRGTNLPPDLYDKDMAALYIVGKLGLGIDRDINGEVLAKLFSMEMAVEDVINKLRISLSYEDFCRNSENICKILDDKFIARVLRYIFTMYYFGFIDRRAFIELMRKAYTVLKPMEETIRRFTKFVIAYEVGKKIAENEVKTRMELNMAKNTIALDFGIPNALPSASYIVDVARHFFNLPQDLVNSLKSENKG